MYETDGVELNSKCVNKNITYSLLPQEEMEKLGFHLVCNGEKYYYGKRLTDEKNFDITLNITLPVNIDQDKLSIDVLDEAFLQPYDFQSMLRKNPNFKYALQVANAFENQMEKLAEAGVLHGHKRGEYV